MHSNYSYEMIGKEDFLLKGTFQNIHQRPQWMKIALNFGLLYCEKRTIISSLLSLEAICGQKAMMTQSKKGHPLLQIRRGMLMGSKVTLRKHSLYLFLDRLRMFLLPQEHLSPFKKEPLTFRIQNPFQFPELEQMAFQSLPPLDVSCMMYPSSKKERHLFYTLFHIF